MKKIFVVDDNEDIRYVLRKMLTKEGYEVEEAQSGQALLDRLKDEIPDLVVLDVMMPGMRTIQILEATKDLQLRVIILTAIDFSEGEKTELMKYPAVKHFAKKPVEEGFIGIVKSLLEHG